MMLALILLFPLLLSAFAWWQNNPRFNLWLVLIHASTHLLAGISFLVMPETIPGYFSTDALGLWFYLIISLLYLAVAIYNTGFLSGTGRYSHTQYTIFMMLFVFTMDGAVFALNLGVCWVFIETTTLVSAMLIYHQRTQAALEAAWKYIFICSIGIALAFVGILLLFIAMPLHASLNFTSLVNLAPQVNTFWLRIAFIFLLCGFGTKLGLAPMHAWLPDAHAEAPAPVSALLSGALLNTALLPLLRINKLMVAAQQEQLSSTLFITTGLLSVFVGAVFMLRATNYKRLLAYSSIENIGIATLAFGVGGMAQSAGLIHLWGHSLLKAAFFLTTGNVYKLFMEKDYRLVSGLRTSQPQTGWLWLLSFLGLAGLPPSPLFISEFILFIVLFRQGFWLIAVVLAFLITVAIYSLARMSVRITSGDTEARLPLRYTFYLPQIILLSLAAITGIFMPKVMTGLLNSALSIIGRYYQAY